MSGLSDVDPAVLTSVQTEGIDTGHVFARPLTISQISGLVNLVW